MKETMAMRLFSGGILTLVVTLFWSCASVQVSENVADYRGRLAELEATLRLDPANPDVLLELGLIRFQVKQFKEARVALEKTLSVAPGNPKALYYLGMVLEEIGTTDEAISIYANHSQFSFLSEYGRLMEGRYLTLTAENARRQITDLVAQEDKISPGEIVPELVAVYPFEYRGADKTYAPLRMGLAELMKRDLSQVKSVTLVERVRIQAILDELRFGQSKFVDPATAPRVGRLLKAGRIVTGFFDVPEKTSFLLNVAYYDLPKGYLPNPRSKGDALENLFALEKETVFDVLDQMGIVPTPVERQKIAERPTSSLAALLLFSQGMEGEVVGNYELAAQKFSQALQIDPNFTMAAEELHKAEVRAAAQTKQRALISTYNFDPPVPSDSKRLITRRQRTLGAEMQPESFPGEDNREPPEEAARAGAAVGDLPGPPDPPRPK